MAKVVQRRELNLLEKAYVPEVLKGMVITARHLAKGFFKAESLPTVSYPEIKAPIPQDYRGKHRLMKRPDGEPRCVACYMCSTACPAQCISIVAMESSDPRIEKKPKSFVIDHLICVFCGLCVEACPVDAIRMDTKMVSIAADKRHKFKATLQDLLDWDPKDFPASDTQSQMAPGGTLNQQAREQWDLEGGSH